MIKKDTLIFVLLLLLVLSAVFTKDYFLFMPGYYFKKVFIYMLLFIIFIQFTIIKIPKINYSITTIMLFTLLFFTQSITLFTSLGYENQNIFKNIISFTLFAFIIFLHYYVLRNFFHILQEKFINYFFKAFYVALGVMLLVNFIQLFSILMPSIFHSAEQFIADHLVLQWSRPDPEDKRFYTIANSYVQTNHRLNGLVEETSEDTAILFLAFIPLILGKISTSIKLGNNLNTYWGNLIWFILIVIILLLSKSSSGLLFAVVSNCFLIYIYLRYATVGDNIIMLSIFFILLIIIALTNSDMIEHYWTKLFDNESISTLSRSGITFGLISLSFDNLLTGVGKGMVSNYLELYIPVWSYTYEIETWINKKGFPALSMFFWLISEYGLPILFLISYILFKTYKGLKELARFDSKYYTVYEAYKYFLIILFITLQAQTMIYKSFLMLITTFYIVIGLHSYYIIKHQGTK